MTYVSASIAVNSEATCLTTGKGRSNFSENVIVASNAAHMRFSTSFHARGKVIAIY